jgi:hypothetical protein
MMGRLEEAAAVHENLLRIMGGHAVSRFAIGELFEEMNRPGDAEQEYKTFLDMWSEADEGLPQLVVAEERLAALKSTK